MPTLGNLEKVDLRSVWANEAGNFTPWLAKPENLKLLSDTLGLDLELEDQEVAVGSFSADIVTKDSITDSKVVIENQIEKTDHSHLGQILTYCAGVDAKTLIWVAATIRDEHRAALDWLNENTNDDISIFGVEIELWKIGDSPPAPKFNIVSKPNDWSKSIRTTTVGNSQTSELRKNQLAFWTAFADWLDSNSVLASRTPKPKNYFAFPTGTSGTWVAGIVSMWNCHTNEKSPEIRADLVIQYEHADEVFESLLAKKDEFQSNFEDELHWDRSEGKQRRRIYLRRDWDYTNQSLWPEQFKWLGTNLEKLRDVFGPKLR
jgi:hypothetical protein